MFALKFAFLEALMQSLTKALLVSQLVAPLFPVAFSFRQALQPTPAGVFSNGGLVGHRIIQNSHREIRID